MGTSRAMWWRSVVVAAWAAAAALIAACGGSPAQGERTDLATYAFQHNDVTRLPGGVSVAVGSPDGHQIVVQWQSKGSDGWTPGATVYTEPEMFTHDISVEVAGDTIAIDPDFWTEQVLDDDYAPHHTAQVICRDRDCADGHRSPDGTPSHTELSRDGTYATFSLSDDKVLVWDDGEFSSEKPVGLPKDASKTTLPDGTLVAIAPQAHKNMCRFRLLTAAKGTTTYVEQAVSADYPTLPPCSAAGVEADEKKISVLLEELPDSIDFVRRDGGWVADEPVSPLQGYPQTDGESSLANDVVSRADGSDVSIGSPDTQRIFAQFRQKGSKEWTAPVQIAKAPDGTSCRFQSIDRTKLVVVDMVSCFDDDEPFDLGTTIPTQGIALATSDGRTWAVETVDRPHGEVSRGHGQDMLFMGASASYLWAPSTPMRRIDLQLGPGDVLASTSEGKVVRAVADVTGGTGCRPGYQVADLDNTSWPKARRFPDTGDLGNDAFDCFVDLYDLDGALQVSIGNEAWSGTLMLQDRDWVAKRRPDGF